MALGIGVYATQTYTTDVFGRLIPQQRSGLVVLSKQLTAIPST